MQSEKNPRTTLYILFHSQRSLPLLRISTYLPRDLLLHVVIEGQL